MISNETPPLHPTPKVGTARLDAVPYGDDTFVSGVRAICGAEMTYRQHLIEFLIKCGYSQHVTCLSLRELKSIVAEILEQGR